MMVVAAVASKSPLLAVNELKGSLASIVGEEGVGVGERVEGTEVILLLRWLVEVWR